MEREKSGEQDRETERERWNQVPKGRGRGGGVRSPVGRSNLRREEKPLRVQRGEDDRRKQEEAQKETEGCSEVGGREDEGILT